MPQVPLFYTCLCYCNDGEKHVKKFWKCWTVLVAVSHLGGNGLPVEAGALCIQAPHHRPERSGLHYPVWKAIGCYPLRNCLLDPMKGLRIDRKSTRLKTWRSTTAINLINISQVLHAIASALLCRHLLLHTGTAHKHIWEHEHAQQLQIQ